MQLHGVVHHHRPAFERDDVEQRQHRHAEAAPVHRVVFVEELVADYRVDVHDDAHQQHHMPDAGDGTHQRRYDEPQFHDRRYEPQHAQQTRQSRYHRVVARRRHERDDYHQEVEHVPAVAEVVVHARRVREHLQQRFEYEHEQDELIAVVKQTAELPLYGLRCAETQDGTVHQNQTDYEVLENALMDYAIR